VRVLVTGANGFVGPYLCKHLRDCGDVVVAARGPPAARHSDGDLAIELSNPQSVRGAIENARPDAIVHLAGLSSVAKSHQDPISVFAVNTLGAVNLLTAVRDCAAHARVVLIGSGEMYGALQPGIRATEDFPLKPLSPYAASKAAAELAGFQFQRASGLEVVSARSFNHIGAGQDANFVVPSFAKQIEAISRGRSPATLRVGDLLVTRDFSHVADIVEAYRLLATRGVAGEAYNVCSGEGRTIRSLVEEMLEIARVRANIEVDRERLRPNELPSLVGDPAKLRKLGWAPSRTVRDALREALDEAAAGPEIAG
jgi:GDP-4-dehydro-6-deoxy-D-mannose reductase